MASPDKENKIECNQSGTGGFSGPWSEPRPGWDPILAMKTIRDTMHELIADIFSHSGKLPYAIPWKPELDVYSDNENLYIDMELPGALKENVQIHATNELVIINGAIKGPDTDEDVQFFTRERKCGSFSRSVPLPYRVVHEGITAKLKEGLLRITIPLKFESPGKPTKIIIE